MVVLGLVERLERANFRDNRSLPDFVFLKLCNYLFRRLLLFRVVVEDR